MDGFAERFPDLAAGLRTRHAEPHRAYHTWDHVGALLGHFRRLDWHNPAAVEIAIHYHDAIYDPMSATNEADSADLMEREMAGRIGAAEISAARALILATAGHRVPDRVSRDVAEDCRLFLDADLSILGAEPAVFDAYDLGIRREYAAIPDEDFLPRRREVMAGFLARERLFLTDEFHRSHDARARENLRRLVGG